MNFNLKPIIELIEECDINLLNEREKYWINYFYLKNCKLTNTSGKMYFRNLNKRIVSNSKSIYCYDENYNLRIFESARQAEKQLNINYKLISNSAIRKKAQKQYAFSFIELSNIEIDSYFIKPTKHGIKIIAKNLETNLEILFSSQMEAAKYLKVNFRNINQVLLGKRFSCANHIFRYENKQFLREFKLNCPLKQIKQIKNERTN